MALNFGIDTLTNEDTRAISTSLHTKVTAEEMIPSEAAHGRTFEFDKQPKRFFHVPTNMSPPYLHRRRSCDPMAKLGLLICTLGAALMIALFYTAVTEFENPSASPFPDLRTRYPYLSCCLKCLGMMVKSMGAITSALLLILIAPVILTIGLELYKAYRASVRERDTTGFSKMHVMV